MHYTFNRDLDVAYARTATEAPVSIDDLLSRLIGVLDQEALLRLAALEPAGRPEIVVQALRAFECSSQRWRRRLQVALREDLPRPGDVLPTIRTFKAAAAVVGALRLSRLCADAERLAQGRPTRDLDDVVDAILSESGRILAVLVAVLASLRRWRSGR